MLRRFSLYGFLKNQRYYDPFLILVFREKGLSFFVIGLLIAFRELTVNLFEVPSGAVADLWGRRRSMVLSFCAYIASFLVLGAARDLPLLFGGMFLFAIGDAFRTGTHKAMIFTWLRTEGRLDERTRVYGYTRSWSKIGSAVSVVVAAAIVLVSGSYVWVFYCCIVPYVLGIVNFLGYPKELEGKRDGKRDKGASFGKVVAHLREALGRSYRQPRLRRIIFESMGFGGVFKAAKDYLQPVLKAAAVVYVVAAAARLGLLPAGAATAGFNEPQKVAILVGPVYFVLYLLSALASRRAHRLVERCGPVGTGEDRAARVLWALCSLVFAAIALAAWHDVLAGVIVGFVLLHVLQNFWRPVLICRVDRESPEAQRATVLSIESQAKSVSTMIVAPVLGLAVDLVRRHGFGGAFWPVGALGAVVALGFFVTARRGERGATSS